MRIFFTLIMIPPLLLADAAWATGAGAGAGAGEEQSWAPTATNNARGHFHNVTIAQWFCSFRISHYLDNLLIVDPE
jgi:hypothetical protein